MRNIIISLAIFFSIILSSSSPLFAVGTVDFNVKISTAGDESYTTTLGNVSYFNTDVTFQFTEISSGGATEYSLNLPSGFVYQSHNTMGNTCTNFSVIDSSNGNYHFSFNGTVGCVAKTEFTYRVTSSSTPGNTGIFLLNKNGSSWSIITDVTVGITSTNSITKAKTADLNANGYIDAYVLSFASGALVNAPALSGVTVAGVTTGVASASGSSWVLPFTDNTLGTGNLPQIGGVFDTVNLINALINEEDGALPRIMTIAGTGTAVASISIGTGSLTMGLSEPLIPSGAGSFSLHLGTGTIAGTYTLTGNLSTLVFTPSSSLVAGTYTLTNTSGATDWPAGTNIMSQTFPSLLVPDITPPGTGSIAINTNAATTTSQIVSLTLSASDNIGVTEMMISNSPAFTGALWETYSTTKIGWSLASSTLGAYTVYVKFRDLALNVSSDFSDSITLVSPPPSGGGGGGGGGGGTVSPDNCPSGDLSGNFYDNICSAPVTSTGATNTGATSTGSVTVVPVAPWIPDLSASPGNLSVSTLDTKYFSTLTEARKYLLDRITHRAIVKLINAYGDKLAIPDESYFMSVDSSLYPEYNRIINAYVILFLRVQDAVSGNRSDTVKSDGRLSVGVVTSGVALVKNFLERYITREIFSEKNITLYRTKNPLLIKPLGALETKILAKFDALLESESISRDEYNTSIQAYNDFVLHLMMYRDYGKNTLSKEKAIASMKVFLATYKKK